MQQFKGFDDWVPVFKTGVHTDSAGNTREWTEEDLDKIVASYDPRADEAPVVIGHPKDDAPAWGWAEGLKREGKLLMAKFRDVVPEFAEMVKRGLFKKRSISIRPDLTLKHIGFLGAVPPAVKGLPNMQFKADDGGVVIEFSEEPSWGWNTLARIVRNIREWFIEKEGTERADQIVSNWMIQDIEEAGKRPGEAIPSAYRELNTNGDKKTEVRDMFKEKLKGMLASMGIDVSKVPDEAFPAGAPSPGGTFTEADLETARRNAAAEAAQKEREKVTAEFAEKDRQARQDARKGEISSWCESMVKAGRLTPAMVKFGISEMLQSFAEKDEVIEFGEDKTKATLFDRFKALFETEIPKVVEFGEVATRDKNTAGQGAAGKQLEGLTRKKMEANTALSYSEAFSAVQRENPDLANEYAAEIRG